MAKGLRINKIKSTSERQFHRIKRNKTKCKKKFAESQKKMVAMHLELLDAKVSKKHQKKMRRKEARKARKQKGMDVDADGIVDCDNLEENVVPNAGEKQDTAGLSEGDNTASEAENTAQPQDNTVTTDNKSSEEQIVADEDVTMTDD